jgi:hypothetical protein
MSTIQRFTRYAGRENIVTNNTLLFFEEICRERPRLFEAVLRLILGDDRNDVELGVRFFQQLRDGGRGSIPDGAIVQIPLQVIIETKVAGGFTKTQLHGHASRFSGNEGNYLLLLDKEQPNPIDINMAGKAKVEAKYVACGSSFEQLIASVRSLLREWDYELTELVDQYEEFLLTAGMLSDESRTMRALASGASFEENVKYGVYYDLADRGYSPHAFLALYKDKALRAVGRVVNIVQADFGGNQLAIIEKQKPVTIDEEKRIIGIIQSALKSKGWNIQQGHRFFIVDQFIATEYPKRSKYPIQRSRYFDLQELLDVRKLPDTSEIAAMLRQTKTEWV